MPPSLSRPLVVVAYFDQRPLQPLFTLLDSMQAHDAGVDYDLVVVVNTTDGERLEHLRSAGVPCLEKSNLGMNIGSWDHGWRTAPDHDEFLFLQDDCEVVRPNWLRAFAEACGPFTGLVGESLNEYWDAPWDELRETRGNIPVEEHLLDGKPANRIDVYLDFMRRMGIDPGPTGNHLRGQVWYARRGVLESIGGFPCPGNRGEWIGAEIGVSRAMEAHGWALAQVHESPYHYIRHHEWQAAPKTGAYTHADSVGRLGRARRRLAGLRPVEPADEPISTESAAGSARSDGTLWPGEGEVSRQTTRPDAGVRRRRGPRSDRHG